MSSVIEKARYYSLVDNYRTNREICDLYIAT